MTHHDDERQPHFSEAVRLKSGNYEALATHVNDDDILNMRAGPFRTEHRAQVAGDALQQRAGKRRFVNDDTDPRIANYVR